MIVDPRNPQVTVDRDGQYRVGNLLTRREFNEIEKIRNSQYFLIRNDGGELREAGVCRKCGAGKYPIPAHPYFTLMCRERPFNGLADGLRIWVQVAGDSERKSQIIEGFGLGIQDYSDSHPETASQLKPVSPNALAWYSYLLGVSIPLTIGEARRYAEKIFDLRPPMFPRELQSLLKPQTLLIR